MTAREDVLKAMQLSFKKVKLVCKKEVPSICERKLAEADKVGTESLIHLEEGGRGR